MTPLNTRTLLSSALSIGLMGILSLQAPAQEWDPEIEDLFARLPVQDGGRVKPLESLASFTLLGMHGKRSLTTLRGDKVDPLQWLLNTMFLPDEARQELLFKVPDSQTVEAIGLSTAGKRRTDRYSYMELGPGLDQLFAIANQASHKETNQRTRVEGQILNLATNVNIFQQLAGALDFARHHFQLSSPRLQELFGTDHAHYSDVVEKGPELMGLWQVVSAAGLDDPDRAALESLLDEFGRTTDRSSYLALFAPEGSAEKEPVWTTVGELGMDAFRGVPVSARHLELIRGFERMVDAPDMPTLKSELVPLSQSLIAGAERRGEYGKIDLEVTYYRLGLTDWGQYLFLASFLLVMLSWLMPAVRSLYHGGWWVTLGANLALTGAIVLRCIVRGRPPVSTLYETILFITAVLVFVALFMEKVNRQKIALSVGSVLGVVGMFLANRFEGLDGVPTDTMPALQAVLDTNFWLATHVTAITIGYSAGLLAAGMGSFYLLAKLFGWRKGNKSIYKSMSRMTYGVICFGLLFSVVGTILGGIWANDSWGRFWGWDPKENGALLIVLMNLAILHGRMGGYLREHGVCTAAAFGGMVVAFSWFHTNQLGVGLHSYGFTEGVLTALNRYYFIQMGIIGLGFIPWLKVRKEILMQKEVEARSAEARKPDEGATP